MNRTWTIHRALWIVLLASSSLRCGAFHRCMIMGGRTPLTRHGRLTMTTASEDDILVCGFAGSAAVSIAEKLGRRFRVNAILVGSSNDREFRATGETLYVNEDTNEPRVQSLLSSTKRMVVAVDRRSTSQGEKDEEMNRLEPSAIIAQLLKGSLQSVRQYCLVVPGRESQSKRSRSESSERAVNFLGSFLRGKDENVVDILKTKVSGEGITGTVVYTGQLIGGTIDDEEPAFLKGPTLDPIVNEAYLRRSALVSGSIAQALTEKAVTCRDSVGSLIDQIIDNEDVMGKEVSLSIVSVVGPETTSEAWKKQIGSVLGQDGIELFGADFDSFPFREKIMDWLTIQWAPTTLKSVEASRRRAGERPSRVEATSSGASIVWETLTDDLDVVITGRLNILLGSDDEPKIRVFRVDSKGDSLSTALYGEEEIIQRLAEGINRVILAKGYARRVLPKEPEEGMKESSPVTVKEMESEAAPIEKQGTMVGQRDAQDSPAMDDKKGDSLGTSEGTKSDRPGRRRSKK